LSTQDGQFVAEHHDLEVFGGMAPELQRGKREHASDENIENGGEHATELSRHRRAAASRWRALRNASSIRGLGFGTPHPGWWIGIVAVIAGIGALWAGSVMTWGRVYVDSNRILTMTNRPHRATRDQIASIDVCRSDFGKMKQVLPVVRLKDGKSFKLPPLCVSGVVGYTPQTPEQPAQMLSQQGTKVCEIQSLLGVGGTDCAGD
jgi:hypothetical protein